MRMLITRMYSCVGVIESSAKRNHECLLLAAQLFCFTKHGGQPIKRTSPPKSSEWLIWLVTQIFNENSACEWANPKSFLRLSRTRPSKHARPIALAITEAAADRCRAEWNPQMHLHDSRLEEKEASIYPSILKPALNPIHCLSVGTVKFHYNYHRAGRAVAHPPPLFSGDG